MSGREERTPGEESSETPSSDQRISLRVSSRNNEEEEEETEESESSSEIEEAHSHDEHPHDHSDEDASDVLLRGRKRAQRIRHSEDEEEEESEFELDNNSSPPDEDEEGDVVGEIPVLTSQPLQEEEPEEEEEERGNDITPIMHQDVSMQTEDDPHTPQETQTSPDYKDQEIEAIPKTRDMGTGEWLAQQKSIGINAVDFFDQKQKDVSFASVGIGGDPLIVEEKGEGDHLTQQDQSIQMNPLMQDESVLMELSAHSVGINPISVHGQDQSIQENIEHQSIGFGSHHSYISGYVQAQMDMINQSIQNDISKRSIGLDPRSFHHSDLSDSSLSRKVSEFMRKQVVEEDLQSSHSSILGLELEPDDQFISKIPLEKSILLEDQMSEEEKYPSLRQSRPAEGTLITEWFPEEDRFLFHKNQICGIKRGITYTFFDPKDVLDYFPLQKSIDLEQEEHEVSIKIPRINFDDQELEESVLINSPKSSIDLGVIQEEENEEHSSIPSSKLKGLVKEDDESDYSIISSQKSSHGVRSLHSDELEDRR